MRILKWFLLAITGILISDVTVIAGTPFIHSTGKVTASLGTSPVVSLQTDFQAGWKDANWQSSGVVTITDNQWNKLQLQGSATLGATAISLVTVFDPQSASFTSTQMKAAFSWRNQDITALVRLEEVGAGFAFSTTGPSDSIVRGIDLRFNLKQYEDEIVEETFCPQFSHATIALEFPIACDKHLAATLDMDRNGVDDMWFQLQPPLSVFPWLSLSMALTFRTDEKTATLSPALSLSSPSCFDFYWGVDWDSTTNTLGGLRLYGIGFHREVAGLEIRSLTNLAPGEISLVKAPYWELFGIAWEFSTCCGTGGASAVLYFGDSGDLFDISEVDIAVHIPAAAEVEVSVTATLLVSGPPSISIGWTGGF